MRKSVKKMAAVIGCLVLAFAGAAVAQQAKGAAKASLTGSYEGNAKNKSEEVIPVTLDLTDKEGALSGMIRSTHGDFTITGGSRDGDTVTIQFDVGGPVGTISLKVAGDKMDGTWTAGDDGGTLDVKKVAAQEGGAKGKS
jgi:hypothetical protein